MKAISLFSGVGGFDLGFERAGIETVLQAERDPWCLKVLERHWPQTERVTDVRDVGYRGLCGQAERRVGSGLGDQRGADVHVAGERPSARGIDLIYGGFPCQDLSVAGKRAGLGGDRSGLWFEFRRIVDEIRPRWVCIENVPGLLSSNQGRDFGIVLNGLDELGYGVAWNILDAQFFGVPQRRRRVFIVGCLGDERSAAAVLSVCESCGGNPEAGREAGERVASGAQDGVGVAENQRGELRLMDVSPALSAGGGKPGSGYSAVMDVAYTISPSRGTGDGHGNAWNSNYIANSLRAQPNASHRADSDTYIPDIAYALAAREAKGVSMLESQTNYVATSGVRRLTPLECERLMGWPDDWTRWDAQGNEIADSHRYRMCGNGVVGSVSEWLGHRLVATPSMEATPQND